MTVHPRHRLLSLLIAALSLVLGLTAAVAPASATRTPPVKPTIVLVHGVFADASGWNATIAALQAAGFPVIAPANPLRDLTSDAEYISSVVDTITGPVILVGHSYGGAVITNAARGHANVKALVYVAAFAPDEGENILQIADSYPGGKLSSSLLTRPFPGGVDGYIDPAKFREVFAADLPVSVTRLMAATQRPGSLGGLTVPSGVPAWKTIPSWFVIPSADHAIPPAAQRFMAQRAGGKVTEVKGASHVVMQSRPETVVKQILAACTAIR